MDDRMREMINAVKKYSVEHWNEDGWDIVAECYEDEEIQKIIVEAKVYTIAEAIAAVGEECGLRDEIRKDVQAEIF